MSVRSVAFTRRRVTFQVSPSLWQSGVVVGSFVALERAWFDGKPSWVRYYRIQLVSGPSSLRGSFVNWPTMHVRDWACLSDSPGEYVL